MHTHLLCLSHTHTHFLSLTHTHTLAHTLPHACTLSFSLPYPFSHPKGNRGNTNQLYDCDGNPTFELAKAHAEDPSAPPHTATAVVMVDNHNHNQNHNQNQNHGNKNGADADSMPTYTDSENVRSQNSPRSVSPIDEKADSRV